MARTKASVGTKVSSGKSSKARCSAAPPTVSAVSAGGSERSSRGHSSGNPVCPRETPKWQRPITNFFICNDADRSSESVEDDATGSRSKPKPKRNIIQSDDDENSPEKPKNTVLDETIELQPLTGENSHKIQEYYTKNGENHNGALHENGDDDNRVVDKDDDMKNGENPKEVNKNGVKGKGVGKKTKGKENKNTNADRKRERDDNDESLSDSEHVNKKIRLE